MIARLLLLALLCLAFARGTAAAEPQPEPASRPQQVLLLLHLPPDHFRPDGHYSGSYGDGFGRSARKRIAAQLAGQHGLALAGDWAMPLIGVDCYVLDVPADRRADEVARTLAQDRRVAWAQPVSSYRARASHGEGGSSQGDPLYAVQPVAAAWRLAELHELATGRDVRVAVVDSGIDAAHPDLDGALLLARDFVVVDGGGNVGAEEHGTGVAGVIGARAGNGIGIAGVAPRARLRALRAWRQRRDDTMTTCDTLSLAKALHYAIDKGAEVVNLSLAGPPDRLLARLIDAALARGISVVAAADSRLPSGGFPASHAGVVAVAAIDEPGRGRVGDTAPLLAPGRDIPTTRPGARWHLVSGSSYAAAHVAGLVALLRELDHRGAMLVGLPAGGIDACATLARALPAAPSSRCGCSCASARQP